MSFDEGQAWKRIKRHYRYLLVEDLVLDLPVPVLTHPRSVAEIHDDWQIGTPVPPAWVRIERRWTGGEPSDEITVAQGYAWDGASGPAIDTHSFMRASCVHDALYQMIREGALPESARAAADANMRALAQEDGMPGIRAWWTWAGVRLFGGSSAARVV